MVLDVNVMVDDVDIDDVVICVVLIEGVLVLVCFKVWVGVCVLVMLNYNGKFVFFGVMVMVNDCYVEVIVDEVGEVYFFGLLV